MKPWIRRPLFVAFWLVIGALFTTCAGLAMGSTSHGWLFPTLLTLAIAGAVVLVSIDKTVPHPSRKRTTPAQVAARSLTIAGSLAIGGLLALPPTFGSFERGFMAIGEFPQRLNGTVEGMWDSTVLESDLALLQDEFAGRHVEFLLLSDSYISVNIISDVDPEGLDHYVLRGGDLSLNTQTPASSVLSAFDLTDVDAVIIHRAVSEVRERDPSADIESVHLQQVRGTLQIDVAVAGTYTSTSYTFDAATGELLEVD